MTTAELPTSVFMRGTRESEKKFDVVAGKPIDGAYVVCVWTSKQGLDGWLSHQDKTGQKSFEIETSFAFAGLLGMPTIRYVFVDPGPSDNPHQESFAINSFPTDRRIDLHSVSDVWSVLCTWLDRGGLTQSLHEPLHQFALSHPELKPLELFNKIAEGGRGSSIEIIAGEKKYLIDALHAAEGTAPIEFLPPSECRACGEHHWTFVSLSPNKKSATWSCSYCRKMIVVKADDVRRQSVSANREAIPKEVQREVWRRDGGKCVVCASQQRLEFDHIIPHAKGGANTARNLQLLCENCNRKKSDKDPGED